MPELHTTLVLVLASLPVCLVLGALFVVLRRKAELRRFERSARERALAKSRGTDKARLQYPNIDLTSCVGCGACVDACPEEGVLDLLHGQAVVIHGSRCVGHARCEDVCPTGAINVTLGNVSTRKDLPAIDENLGAIGVPGLYLAGELTGFALVRTAVEHGTAVANHIAHEIKSQRLNTTSSDRPDLLIIGAGPAGLACALRAKELGLSSQIIEQSESLGGTVAGYPRRKMVMTQPLRLPLHGKLPKLEYQKETLIELWTSLAEKHNLDIVTNSQVTAIHKTPEGLAVETSTGRYTAPYVCLALGRRGTPRKLGVPGEDRSKVLYSLIDSESYSNCNILVVGGGDSAVEAAIGLSRQPGNTVTLSYRGKDLTRVKSKNEKRILEAASNGTVRLIFESNVTSIEDESVTLRIGNDRSEHTETIPNDFVFVMVGGIPPFKLLEEAGVSFDPADRPTSDITQNKGTSVLPALVALLICALGIGIWVAMHSDYYSSPVSFRPASPWHEKLRPSGPIGLPLGVFAVSLFVWNLSYLIRRSTRLAWLLPGSLKFWMGTHIFSGLLSFLVVMLHSGFAVRQTVGGHAFLALLIVVASGLIGRYLYAFVPRAANGKELDLEDLKSRLAVLSGAWDRHGGTFGLHVRKTIDSLADEGRWRGGLLARIRHLVVGQFVLRRTIRSLRTEARREGVSDDVRLEIEVLARTAFRVSLQIAHYEEIRAVLSSWRYIHRWLALLMVLLTVAHIVTAVRYADLQWPSLSELWP
ncbi:MAG TPA: 4Fe-4S dicluster domain-containing protein [Phycisphaerales bacterium]|nr:4Fe-4S dicluster domain-containing protein [Phycisphaerales bacterium]